ncbi:MAG: methyltransferase domain-containing protein [Rubrivivax sp.]|nr:methyltransferase domain-containing protein [Rubrivivax sp.]
MDHTDQYYEQFSAEFVGSTVGVDMAPILQRFLAQLKPAAHILDAGCGTGRDAKAYAEAGFQVTDFDASPELALLASVHCGFEVALQNLKDDFKERVLRASRPVREFRDAILRECIEDVLAGDVGGGQGDPVRKHLVFTVICQARRYAAANATRAARPQFGTMQ